MVAALSRMRKRFEGKRTSSNIVTYMGLSKAKEGMLPEIVSTPSSLMQSLSNYVPPIDSGLITTTGKTTLEETNGLEIFAEMLRDPQIKASLGVKKYAVISSKWNVSTAKGADKDKQATEIRDFIEWNLSCLLGNTGLGLDCVLSAFAYGRSDCELVFDVVQRGPYQGKYYLKALKPKNIGYISYDMDDFENIASYRCTDLMGKVRVVPPQKMLHYAWDPEFGNPYGVPDLAACYVWYWAKKTLYKYFMIFADKYASPIPVFKLERNITAADRTTLETTAKDYHLTNSIILPKGVELELEQNNGTAGQIYVRGIQECDSQISRAILFQTLTTNENIRTGTNAQAQVHQDTLGYLLKKILHDVERLVEQLIQQLVDLNYGDTWFYPKFEFEVIDAERFAKLVEAVNNLTTPPSGKINSVVDIREPWIRSFLGLPQRDEEEFPFEEEMNKQDLINMKQKSESQNEKSGTKPGKSKPGSKPPSGG